MTSKKRKPEQPDAQIIQGHVLDVLAGMEAESVSCVVTSPPYWSQRKYDAPDIVWGGKPKCKHRWVTHPGDSRGGSGPGAKEAGNTYARSEQRGDTCSRCGAWRGQLGLEPTPELYVEHTLDVLRAIRRVLRLDGCVWWNIGDGYAGGSVIRGDGKWPDKHDPSLPRTAFGRIGTLKPKDLVLMPDRVALAAQADGWWVRSKVIWNKTNAMPESCKDRPTTSHEYLLMLTKNATYWYDQEAVREAHADDWHSRASTWRDGKAKGQQHEMYHKFKDARPFANPPNPSGRNMRSVWTFPTAQTPEAHFATFPEELPRRCILASCPSDGTVLDPFAGTGTTGAVAQRLGRRFVGIELSEKYCAMAAKRMEQTTLGMPL